MNYTFCEKLMWAAMTPTIFKYIKSIYPTQDMNMLKTKSKKYFQKIIQQTPDIGGMFKNPLRVSLSGGIVWISIYRAMDERMSEDVFAGMVKETMKAPIIKKAFGGKKPFSEKAQQKKLASTKTSNECSDSPFNWNAEFIPGRDADEYTVIYHQCGLCALGKQEHLEKLIPYMCEMDFISVELMGGVLHRTKTLAKGDDCCDFYICKKGSKWDV